MAGLFEGTAPPDITKTTTTAQQAPQYLTDYLTNLAQVGQSQLGTTGVDASGKPTMTAFQGKDLIASRPDYLTNLTSGIDPATGKPYAAGQLPALSDLARYQTPLDQALTAGKSAMDVSSADIAKFYNPYQQQVIDEMQKQSDINLQRSVLPGLKALGISGGQFGGSRVGNIGGQALADIAARLQAQQTEARSKGFETALDAALREQTGQTGAATALTGLGSQEQQAAKSALGTLSDLGSQQLEYEQSKIEAPLTRAANVAALLRNYQYPTTTTETYKGPGTVYGPSTLQQIAGLGTLVGAAFPAGGKGIGDRLINAIKGAGTPSAGSSDQWLVDLIGTDTDTTTTGGSVIGGEYEGA
jgi:hypothetical protein